MADNTKVLGQVSVQETISTLYTVPELTQTTISSITICNRSGIELSFRVSIHVDGAAIDDKQYLFFDTPIAGNSLVAATLGMTLDDSDVIQVVASAIGITINLFGVETS
jgi:hypothetical protein